MRAQGRKLRTAVTKRTGFFGAPGRHRGWVEEQHDRTLLEDATERVAYTVLIDQSEVRSSVTLFHTVTLRVEAKANSANGDQMARFARIVFDFLAQTLDVRIECSGVGQVATPPQFIEAFIAGDHLTEA